MFELVSAMFEIEKVGKCYMINFEKESLVLESQDESTIINISDFKIILDENFNLQNKGRKIIFQNEDYGTVIPMFLAELTEYLDVDELFVEWWENVGEIKDKTIKEEKIETKDLEIESLITQLELFNIKNLKQIMIDEYLRKREFELLKEFIENDKK